MTTGGVVWMVIVDELERCEGTGHDHTKLSCLSKVAESSGSTAIVAIPTESFP